MKGKFPCLKIPGKKSKNILNGGVPEPQPNKRIPFF